MKKNSHLRDFARYASLNVLGMIGVSCYILADTFFVAKGMGADGVTALKSPFRYTALSTAPDL